MLLDFWSFQYTPLYHKFSIDILLDLFINKEAAYQGTHGQMNWFYIYIYIKFAQVNKNQSMPNNENNTLFSYYLMPVHFSCSGKKLEIHSA